MKIIYSGDKVINAHKMILCAASDYFAAMFMTNLKESNEREIVFREMDGEILWKLVNFCYTGIVIIRLLGRNGMVLANWWIYTKRWWWWWWKRPLTHLKAYNQGDKFFSQLFHTNQYWGWSSSWNYITVPYMTKYAVSPFSVAIIAPPVELQKANS